MRTMSRRFPCARARALAAPLLGLGSAFALLAAAAPAAADEPRSATEPRVMMEPGYVVDVIDAFDDNGDPFDLNLSLAFGYSSKSARITRETTAFQPGLSTGNFTAHTLNVADYSATTTRLVPRVDIGIYHDLALHVSLPIILNYAQNLKGVSGEGANSPALAGAPGEGALFKLPFTAPTRSGLEYLEAGLDVDIFNQARDQTKPTWLFGFAGRFGIGTPMHACNNNPPAGQVKCADPGDINRNGQSDQRTFMGAPVGDAQSVAQRTPGVTRGTIAMDVHTLLSKRVKYVEPYGGFSALFEVPEGDSDYHVSDFQSTLVNHPPLVGTMIAGLMIHPWENREKYSRITLDFRFQGEYHSEGRDYSELFDALGSSSAPSIRQPQWSAYTAGKGGTSVVDLTSPRDYFSGLADVQAYGAARGSIALLWQASELIRFQVGAGYRHDEGHGISNDQPCNPDNKSDIDKSGPCHSGDPKSFNLTPTGTPNPNYRPTINSVGRRFFVDASNTFDMFASISLMF
jgi:hypothetical protein